MVYGIERFRVIDGHRGRTGSGFVLIEAYSDGGGRGRRAVVVECLALKPC